LGRIYSHRTGCSHSTRPTSKRTPTWVTHSPDEVAALVVKLAKDGLTSSEIGVRIRDEYCIPLVKSLMGKPVSEILKENNLAPALPEDLKKILDKVRRLQAHLQTHHGDHKNVRSLELLEARIHRLSKYYRSIGVLPRTWKYSAKVAQLA
jgi:small subunit ribosomal protein S15